MSLNETPSAERVHIGFFGRRNVGKSSLVNAVTGQDLSVVSDVLGTTTDPVNKSMELLPIGPVVIIDTPGFDDVGELGQLRVGKTKQVLNKTDIAILVTDVETGLIDCDLELLNIIKAKGVPYLIVYNKNDINPKFVSEDKNSFCVSALNKTNIYELKEKIAQISKLQANNKHLVADMVKSLDLVILVIPIDEAAPKGRLILPQQQAIRDLLEAGAVSICVRERELKDTLEKLSPRKPDLVITDSQAFKTVAKILPKDVTLTSFSILMARYKGFLDTAVKGVRAIDDIKDGDKILICEGCTHHRQCGDIGSVKIPSWLKKHSGKNFDIELTSGRDYPEDLSDYSLVIHCGGCMLNEREVVYRMKCALDQGIPFTNYGTTIAYMNGILDRSLEVFSNTEG